MERVFLSFVPTTKQWVQIDKELLILIAFKCIIYVFQVETKREIGPNVLLILNYNYIMYNLLKSMNVNILISVYMVLKV